MIVQNRIKTAKSRVEKNITKNNTIEKNKLKPYLKVKPVYNCDA